VMRPSSERLEPDANSAVITLFRRREKVPMEFGIWTDSGFVGTLADNQALELRVPAGQHLFSATLNNTTVISAAVEAGKRYHAWLDVGKMMGRLRLTPVTLNEQKNLDKWLADVDWVEMNSDLLTPRATQREEIIVQHLRSLTEKLATGEVEFSTLGSDHAY